MGGTDFRDETMKGKIQKLEPAWHELGVGPALDWLDPEAKRAWDELVSMSPPGAWIALNRTGVAVMSHLVAECRKSRLAEDMLDALVGWMADYLLAPEHFERLLGFKYEKPWPDPNHEETLC
jgi:hypothetical protein